MFEIVLFQPEIPPNTGNVIRLCANTAARLHLIRPLGFELDDKRLRRAGLDYHEYASVQVHDSLQQFLDKVKPPRMFALTTKGSALYAETTFLPGDAFLFGPESRGLPADILQALPQEQRLRVPMVPHARSINLSNAVALVLYEAWRQQGFAGGV
jgi:tRNA (cytidine/uridine-2'-O-)-methyltransferase